jgi:hypothetical protein
VASKVLAFGEIGVGILVVAGSATGNLAPMLAALLDPKDLTNGGSSGSSGKSSKSTTTKTTTTTSNPSQSSSNGISSVIPANINSSNIGKLTHGISSFFGSVGSGLKKKGL